MLRLLTGLAALTLTACATSPAPSLEVAGNRLFVAATINSLPVSALLDSAAEMSFADAAWSRENGLTTAGSEVAKGSGGTAEVTFAEHVTMDALGVRLDDATIAVLDLSDISKRLIGRPVQFILGREIFDKERLAIDIEGGSITIADRTLTPDGIALPLTGARGIESFEARVNGQPVGADFDLGNGTDIMIGKAMAEKLGLLSDPAALETRKGGGIGGALDRKIVRLKTLEIAGVKFENVEAAIDENDSAGELNVGVGVLRKFRITTDFEQRRIWLAPR